jgi:hypothetical protein
MARQHPDIMSENGGFRICNESKTVPVFPGYNLQEGIVMTTDVKNIISGLLNYARTEYKVKQEFNRIINAPEYKEELERIRNDPGYVEEFNQTLNDPGYIKDKQMALTVCKMLICICMWNGMVEDTIPHLQGLRLMDYIGRGCKTEE